MPLDYDRTSDSKATTQQSTDSVDALLVWARKGYPPDSPAKSMSGHNESAAQRALGIFEIVDLIAVYSLPSLSAFHTGRRCDEMTQSIWESSGQAARGVNKLWQHAFDQRIGLMMLRGSSELYLAVGRVPASWMSIMANSSGIRSRVDSISLASEAPQAALLVFSCSATLQRAEHR